MASIIWAAPRLQADVIELKTISEQLTAKYGKEFAHECQRNTLENVNEKLIHKLSVKAPPRMLVDQYLEMIAQSYKVPFTPEVTFEDQEVLEAEGMLIDLNAHDKGKGNGVGRGGGGAGQGGGGGAAGGGGGGGMFDQQMHYPPAASGAYNGGIVRKLDKFECLYLLFILFNLYLSCLCAGHYKLSDSQHEMVFF